MPAGAAAEPLRLRGDAYAETASPVGLVVLHGEDRIHPGVDAETVTWLGFTDSPSPAGDVLTLSVRFRDLRSGSELRAGRMIVSMGAVRPLQIDGARALGRVFGGTTVEAFGGFPVARRFDYATFDWATAVASVRPWATSSQWAPRICSAAVTADRPTRRPAPT